MAINASVSEPDRGPRGSAIEVWLVFTKLGLTSFGGPIAHIGYFREEFVVRRGWLEEHAFADLVALFQFLPGPTSSQVGFSIGVKRAGYLGGLAAWLGFTLPSAIALVLFAYGAGAFAGTVGTGLLHGLKLVAVAIVAQAVWHGPHPVPRRPARVDSARGFAHRSQRNIGSRAGSSDAGGCAWWAAALPRRRTEFRGAAVGANLAQGRTGRAGIVRGTAGGPADCDGPGPQSDACVFRCLLSLRRAGLRRRSRRSAAAPRGGRHARMDRRQRVSRRLWRDASRARTAFHVRGVSGSDDRSRFARGGRGNRTDRHLSPWPSPGPRHVALLGSSPQPRERAGGDARCQRRRGRAARCRALRSRVGQRSQNARRLRPRAHWLRASGGVALAAIGGGHHRRCSWHRAVVFVLAASTLDGPDLVSVSEQSRSCSNALDELAHFRRTPSFAVSIPRLVERLSPQVGWRERQRVEQLDLAVRHHEQHGLGILEAPFHFRNDVPRIDRQRDPSAARRRALSQTRGGAFPLGVAARDGVPVRGRAADAHHGTGNERPAAERQ